MILTESPRRQRVTKMVSWGHWFAFANIILALMISSIYLFSSPAPGSWLGNTYMMANWLGHISFITFFGFVIFLLPLCYWVSSEKAVRLTGSVIAALGLALLAFDALLYTRTGFHISFSAAELVKTEAQTRIAEFGWQRWTYLLLLFVIWLGCQLVLANAIWRRLDRLAVYKIGASVTSFFLTCFVTSHAVHVWADAQLYQPIIKQDNLFPLSYPATAKTTMSRYGLLDLERYEQRKELQFSSDVSLVSYPSAPIYCRVDRAKNALVLIQTDAKALALDGLGMNKIDKYYTLASSQDSMIVSAIYGVPEIYADKLEDKPPVLLALPQAQGMQVSVSHEHTIAHPLINSFQQALAPEQSGIHIAFASAQTIANLLTPAILADSIVVVAGKPAVQDTPTGVLYSNLPLSTDVASTEDIAPTVLGALGCTTPVKNYSTGRNLSSPERNWLVSTSGERIVVVHNMHQIEVLSNGSYEITNLNDNSRSNDDLNVNLLSQAIKHLTQFSGSK